MARSTWGDLEVSARHSGQKIAVPDTRERIGMMVRFPSNSRWPRFVLVVAATLAIPAVFLAGPASNRSGFSVALADAIASGSNTTLRYHALIPSGHRIERADAFRIIDVPGYVAGSALAPADWAVGTEWTSPTQAPGLRPTRGDDPRVANLIFTYLGPEPITGPVPLAGFSMRSTSGTPRAVRGYLAQSTRATGRFAGSKIPSAGDVHGPGKVPEPGSLISACLGVIILGFVYASAHRQKIRISG